MTKHQFSSINRSIETSSSKIEEPIPETTSKPTLESKSEGKKVISVPATGGDRPQRQPAGQRRGGFRPRQPAQEFLAHGIVEDTLEPPPSIGQSGSRKSRRR